ncbi:hypothetical protein ACE1B6_16175 [Aerosakkonemataceae cyanobacterium BLCC-F154]|uniref:Uncharacterized protein n=1 Tax=Floridaenema fluviatile BLCC-F154 TaxID=3153640 RepID=A0ABV4YD79_9CYAN
MAAEQNQPLDANSRLKQRMRATVPPRDTSVIKRQSKEEEATAFETEKLSDTLSKPTIATEKEKKLVSFTLRVEDSVDKGLKSLCTQENITKETFLEAAYLVCLENEEMMQQVLEVAIARRQERRETGILRRAKSMTRYLQDS